MRASRRAVRGPVFLGVLVLAAWTYLLSPVGPDRAQAASPLKVREVFPGSPIYGANAEFVELQMTAHGQSSIQGQVVHFYDVVGDLSSIFTIPSDVPNGESQRTVLLATQEAVEGVGGLPSPDFNIGSGADRMDPSGGAVCLTGALPADCVTWGAIPLVDIVNPYLPDGQLANAPAIDPPVNEATRSLTRRISLGCPTYLDSPDDTNDSSIDFVLTDPSPRNNAAAPTETRCPPDTILLSFPANPTNQASALFTYAELPPESGVTFECKLDSSDFASCPTGGKSYSSLADGVHTFQVRAIGEGGTDPTPKSHTWTIDTVAPETTIASTPPEPSGGFSATFTYESSEPFSSFRCQLDDGAIQVCGASGKTYFQLTDGPHTFRVWARDNAGNEDPSPATHAFTVTSVLSDASPPDTFITAAPPNPSPSENATFAYASTEDGSSFECSLNGASFAPCPATGITYSRLRNALYTFAVRATDPAGNVDSVASTHSWRVAAPPPRTRFVKAPPGRVNLRRGRKVKLVFRYRANKPVSGFRCRLNKQRFRPCRAVKRLRVPVGRHRFEVYAIDDLGNVEPRPQRRIVRVQRKKKRRGLF